MNIEKKLFEAIEKKDERGIIEVVNKGADVNAFNSLNQTPLMVAADKGLESIARILLLLGADINKASDYGRTALSYALMGHTRELEMVQLLVENGADIQNKVLKKDGFYTLRPLVQAVLYSDTEIVAYLLEKGAEGKEEALPFLKTQQNQKMLDLLEGKKKPTGKNLKTFLRNWLLKEPIKRIKPKVTETYLMKKIEEKKYILPFLNEFMATYGNEKTILLHWATRCNCLGTMDMLIKVGFDVNFLWLGDRTPLKYAVLNGNIKAAKLLIENGADVNLKDKFGETVLHSAVRYSDKKMVDLLLKSGANINQESGTHLYQTPLMIAAEKKDTKMIKYLIEKGADVNFVSTDGKTALYWALLGKPQTDSKLLEALLQGGADMNQAVCLRENYWATPLEMASFYEDVSAVKFLTGKKAWGNEAAFFIAKRNNDKRIMKLCERGNRGALEK